MATFNGVTFEERTVRSLDDARINNALFSDGILTGCALTYSGANLTIAKGALMVKGREIAVDNNETIASTPTYSNGYGRLKYVINLGAAASSSTFTQGATAWQYASTNSFAALTQEDINDGTSTTYEIEICRVKYTSGSITSIESQIAACLHDYVYWRGYVTASDSVVWFVKKWRSGRIEADALIRLTNTSALTYVSTAGGYAAYLPDVIAYPYAMSALIHDYSITFLRPCMILSSVNVDLSQTDSILLSSTSTAPFGATGTILQMYIHIEGTPA